MPPSAQIANPNPQSGTNNQYTVDGRFSNCSDVFNAPGVSPIVLYLDSLPYAVEANCQADHYYMLNNTNPGFLPNGTMDTKGIAAGTSIPPSSVRTIGDALNDANISWAYYGGAYNAAVNLANGSTNPADAVGATYCNICNFESYASSIMGNSTQRAAHIKMPRTSMQQSATAPCPRCLSSSPTACSTVIPQLRKSICSKVCCRRSSTRSTAIPH
jgi:phospholipase C